MKKNIFKNKIILFNRLNCIDNSFLGITEKIIFNKNHIDSNIQTLSRIGYENLNWNEILKIKKNKELKNENAISNIKRTLSFPNLRKKKKIQFQTHFKSSSSNLKKKDNSVKHKKIYINTLNHTFLKSNSNFSSVNYLSPTTISSTLNNSINKGSFFITSETPRFNKMRDIKNFFLRKVSNENNKFLSSKKLLRNKSENKIKISKINLDKLKEKINNSLNSSNIFESNLEEYVRKLSLEKTEKHNLYHDFKQIKKILLKDTNKERIKTHFFNKRTGRTELIEMNNANLIRFCDNVNNIKDSRIAKWGNKLFKRYKAFEKKLDIKIKEDEKENIEDKKKKIFRKQMSLNSFRINKKIELLIREKNKII